MKKLILALIAAVGIAYYVVRQQEKKAQAEARLWAEAADEAPQS